MICTPRRISRNRCLFPEHVNAGRVFSRADHETELAPPLISIKVGKSQEGGEQASDPSALVVADFIQRKPYHQGSKNARDKPEGFDIRSSYEDDLIFATMQRSLFRSFE